MDAMVNRVWQTFAMAGAAGYLVAVGVTLVDVVGRMLGITLIHGAIDIVIICMVLAAAFAVPLAEWEDAHVRVDPLSAWIPTHLRPIIDRVWSLVSGILVGLIALRALAEALLAHGYGEVMPSLGISLAVLGVLVAIGFAVGSVAAIYVCVRPRSSGAMP